MMVQKVRVTTIQIFNQTLRKLGLYNQSQDELCFQMFKQPTSLYFTFKNFLQQFEEEEEEEQQTEIDDIYYIQIMQGFLEQKQLSQLKAVQLLQTWIIYQIKDILQFNKSIASILQIVRKALSENQIAWKECIFELAKKQVNNYSEWIIKNQQLVKKCVSKITKSRYYIQYLNSNVNKSQKTEHIQQKQNEDFLPNYQLIKEQISQELRLIREGCERIIYVSTNNNRLLQNIKQDKDKITTIEISIRKVYKQIQMLDCILNKDLGLSNFIAEEDSKIKQALNNIFQLDIINYEFLQKFINEYQKEHQVLKNLMNKLKEKDKQMCYKLNSCHQNNNYEYFIQYLVSGQKFYDKMKEFAQKIGQEYSFNINELFLKQSILAFLSWIKQNFNNFSPNSVCDLQKFVLRFVPNQMKNFHQVKAIRIMQKKMQQIFDGNDVNLQKLRNFISQNKTSPRILNNIKNKLQVIDLRLYNNFSTEFIESLTWNETNFAYLDRISQLQAFCGVNSQIQDLLKCDFQINLQSMKQFTKILLLRYKDLCLEQQPELRIPQQKLQLFFTNLQRLMSKFCLKEYQQFKMKILEVNLIKDINIDWQQFYKKSFTESCKNLGFSENQINVSQFDRQKIKQKHEQLIFIINQMCILGGEDSIQLELQKHILVSFEKAYLNNSSQISHKLMKLEQIQNKLSSQQRMNQYLRCQFEELKTTKENKIRYNILEGIKTKLAPLDIYLLKYLISLAKKNWQLDKRQQNNKNITLLVGPSGSGKATIMLRVLGYQFEQTKIKQWITLQPIGLRPEHYGLENTSITRYMFSAKIPKDSFAAGSYQDLYICDSPRFQDSAGCEVDISNSISIQTLLKSCASVKLVVVISQRKVGDKMEGIKQIARIVSNLVVKYSDIEKNVLIVFNEFKKQQEFNRIKPGVQSILNSLTAAEKTNTQYVTFLRSLYKRLNPKVPEVIRFDPYETDIPDFVEQMLDGMIMNPREVFRYSLSSKSNQCISNRKAVLIKLIKDSLGKDNKIAFYYLNQLILLSQCLNNSDMMVEIQGIKDDIKMQVSEKVKTFEKKIEGQILTTDSNNSFFELNKIKKQVQSYQVFARIIYNLPTTKDIQQKIKEVEQKILEETQKMSFDERVIQQTKKKVVRNIIFLGKYELSLQQKAVLQQLSKSYQKNKKQLNQFLKNKEYKKVRDTTIILKNIFQVIQKGRAVMKIYLDIPEIATIDKKEFEDIIQRIKQQFERLSQSSTKFIEVFKMNPSSFQIKQETINNINNNIKIFQEIQTQGPILNQIYARTYKTQIINNICMFGKELISQLIKIVDPKSKQEIESSKIEYLRHNKKNAKKLTEIQGVYGVIGVQIDKLWNNFQRFISIETKRLNDFLNELKNEKQINLNTLKNFKKMIERIMKFSQGDEDLINSTNQLKFDIKKSLGQHVRSIKSKIDKVKITLKLKRTLELEQLKKAFEKFKEIEAFFKVKQLSQQKYLGICKLEGEKSSASKMKNSQQERENEQKQKQLAIQENEDEDEDEDEDYEDINIKEIVTELYQSIIMKLANPFNEIKDQSKKIMEKGICAVTSNYLNMLNEFIQYKNLICQHEIYENRDLRLHLKKLNQQEGKNVGSIIEKIKMYFDTIYESTIEEKNLQKQIYKLPSNQVREFRKLSALLLQSKRYTLMEELFLQQGLGCHQYLTKVVQILAKSSQMIKSDLSSKTQSSIDHMDNLLCLKKQIEEMKPFDQLEFQQKFKFSEIYKKVSEQIKERQSNSITNLFKDETIIISKVKRMYLHLSNDGLKNEDNLIQIQTGLHAYGEKLMKSIHNDRQDFKNDQMANLDSQNAITYINKLQKMFKVYEELKQFMNNNFLQKFALSEVYFIAQIEKISFEEKIKNTYEDVKSKINSYQYKKKPRQFEKIIASLKKIEYFIDKLSINNLYFQLYSSIESSEKDSQGFKGNKFTQRLKFFKAKSQEFVKNVLSQQTNLEQFIDNPKFLSLYNNLPPQEQQTIDMKLQPLLQQKIDRLQNSYGKTDEQKRVIEEDLKEMAGKLPNSLRKIFKAKFQDTKEKLKKKEQEEVKNIKKELTNGNENVFQSVNKFISCKNLTIEKQIKGIIDGQLKKLGKDILVIDMDKNKRIMVKQSFKNYLKSFGSKNSQMMNKIKNNSKLKDCFASEQSAFLKNLITQQKYMIQEIQGEIVRCSLQGLETCNIKCKQLNQLYVLALDDQFQGLCVVQRQQMLSVWEDYIKKIQERIKKLFSTPKPNIIHQTANKLEKNIIEWKFIRIFIENFSNQSKQLTNKANQKYKFAQETYKSFQLIDSDHVIINNLAIQINELLNEVRSIEFYDQQIKILNFASLQKQFQKKVINPLKMLSQYEQIYNKCLCSRETDKYSKKDLVDTIRSKWQENIQNAKKEFESALTYPQEQISQRIGILHNLTQIVTNQRWDTIDPQLESRENLELFLENKFSLIMSSLENDLVGTKAIISTKQRIYSKYQQVKILQAKQFDIIIKQTNAKKKEVQAMIDETVDEDCKEKLKLQQQNIESFKNQKIQEMRTTEYNKFVEFKNANEAQLRNFIKTNVIKHLIIMEKIIQSVHWKSKDNANKIREFLRQINNLAKNINKIIFDELNASNNNYALIIAADPEIFKPQAEKEFMNRTSKQGIEYILKNCPELVDDQSLTTDVINFYRMYSDEYNKIIENFKTNPNQEEINIIAKQLRDIRDKNQAKKNDNTQSAHIIAKIFATWSMTKVDLSYKVKISVDFQPHPAQIVAIYLLIGPDPSKIKNSLIEVLTGQGKSIVLAGLCMFLALKGYNPYCACYSQYLSSRDEKEFKALFELLGISSKIKYGTFNQHCEEIINESSATLPSKSASKTFRQHMRTAITSKAQARSGFTDFFSKIFDTRSHQNSKKVLIIDEVDVFFNQNFFGRLYCPSLSLDDEDVKKLIEYVWKVTKESRQNDKIDQIQKQQIYASEQYKKVVLRYPLLEDLIKNQILGLLQAVYNYHHQYIIHQDSIKYRENDSITDKISYGYKTVFVNCLEYQIKAISKISYESALKITLNISSFSYSQLPTFFQSILGVSGTVSSMSEYKRSMLEEKYLINKIYKIPSIFCQSQRTNDNFTVVQDQQFYDQIVGHTKKISQTSRPIAIFFKTIKDVTNFYKSPQFKQFTRNTTILTEQTDHESRQTIIKRVGQRGKITILTEYFARGTDFKMFDKTSNEIGGLHVIQTFISSDLSEYIQTRGRTARQGNKGSFEVLVNETELQRFEIICKQNSEFEQKMKNAWKKKDQVQTKQLSQRVQKAIQKHLQTQTLFKRRPAQKDIIQFVCSQNKFNQIKKNHVKTLIGIDGTASMGAALKKVLDILQDSFTRTKKILQENKVSGSFANQIGIYRNYNSDFEKLLEYSGFETDSQRLKQFLQKIQIGGGWGNEAMQVLFQHANKINKLDQIIIIADAKSNPPDETKYKREKKFGEKYWIENGFPYTTEGEQVLKLKQKKVKIHTLYIYLDSSPKQKKQQLRQYCQTISKQTGGLSQEFRIKDYYSSEFLTGFLVKNILMQIGGEEKGRELVESYNQQNFAPMRM